MIEDIEEADTYRCLMTDRDLLKLWVATRDEALAVVLESALLGLKRTGRVVVELEVEA